MQTKTIAMLLLVAIATIGAIGIGTATQSAQAFFRGPPNPSPNAINHACDSGHPSASHAEICTG